MRLMFLLCVFCSVLSTYSFADQCLTPKIDQVLPSSTFTLSNMEAPYLAGLKGDCFYDPTSTSASSRLEITGISPGFSTIIKKSHLYKGDLVFQIPPVGETFLVNAEVVNTVAINITKSILSFKKF